MRLIICESGGGLGDGNLKGRKDSADKVGGHTIFQIFKYRRHFPNSFLKIHTVTQNFLQRQKINVILMFDDQSHHVWHNTGSSFHV